jgi:hypothetical protein
MAKISISAMNFTSLRGIPTDELEFSDEIANGATVYSKILGKKISNDDMITALQANNFYPPNLQIKPDGFFMNWEEKTLPIKGLVDFAEVEKGKDKNPSFIYLTVGDDKTVELKVRFELQPETELSSREILSMVDSKDPKKSAEFLISIIVPPTQTTIPEGLYKIKTIENNGKSAKILLDGDVGKVLTNPNITDKVTHIKSIGGYIYTSNSEGKCISGISIMGNSIALPDPEACETIGIKPAEVGSKYQFIGCCERKFDNGIGYTVAAKELDSDQIFFIRADASMVKSVLLALSLNKKRFAVVNKIIKPFGNMKYPKAEFNYSSEPNNVVSITPEETVAA